MIFFTNFATKYLNIIVMKKSNIIMWIDTLLLTAVAGTTQSYAQLLKGRERVTTVSELKEGHVYFLVSDRIASRVTSASIYSEVMGSDHCPVGLTIEL